MSCLCYNVGVIPPLPPFPLCFSLPRTSLPKPPACRAGVQGSLGIQRVCRYICEYDGCGCDFVPENNYSPYAIVWFLPFTIVWFSVVYRCVVYFGSFSLIFYLYLLLSLWALSIVLLIHLRPILLFSLAALDTFFIGLRA